MAAGAVEPVLAPVDRTGAGSLRHCRPRPHDVLGGRRRKKPSMPQSGRARVRLARRRYRPHLAQYPVTKPLTKRKFLDESGLHIALRRRYGWALPGKRAHAGPKSFGFHVSRLASLCWYGGHAIRSVDGAGDAAVFRAYVAQGMVPTRRPGDGVVRANLRALKLADMGSADGCSRHLGKVPAPVLS